MSGYVLKYFKGQHQRKKNEAFIDFLNKHLKENEKMWMICLDFIGFDLKIDWNISFLKQNDVNCHLSDAHALEYNQSSMKDIPITHAVVKRHIENDGQLINYDDNILLRILIVQKKK